MLESQGSKDFRTKKIEQVRKIFGPKIRETFDPESSKTFETEKIEKIST